MVELVPRRRAYLFVRTVFVWPAGPLVAQWGTKANRAFDHPLGPGLGLRQRRGQGRQIMSASATKNRTSQHAAPRPASVAARAKRTCSASRLVGCSALWG